MNLCSLALVLGGTVSFWAGAASGMVLHSWMTKNPEAGPDRYRMTLHKEALWSAFLCFAVAGWLHELPGPEWAHVAVAASFVWTGWGAIGQYTLNVRAGVTNAYVDATPPGVDFFGKTTMLANIAALVGLTVLAGAAALSPL